MVNAMQENKTNTESVVLSPEQLHSECEKLCAKDWEKLLATDAGEKQ